MMDDGEFKRNFLRFGKRSSEVVSNMFDSKLAPGGDGADSPAGNLHRRDYREFVRFGKRKVLPAAAAKAMTPQQQQLAAAAEEFAKRPDNFLRFGKNAVAAAPCLNSGVCVGDLPMIKKSNDFLRFGK